MVAAALEFGYRHIDTAQGYGNEEEVGKGIARADVHRDEFILATKAHRTNLAYQDVIETTKEILDRLGVDFVDLLYVHWPVGPYDPEETFAVFTELVDRDLANHIGVSNFTIELLEEARGACDRPIVANQVEMYPYQQQEELVEYLQEQDMYLVAYTPLARTKVLEIPELIEIAEKHGVTPPQVSLTWLLEKDNVVPIPMADKKEYIRENWEARNLELDPADIAKIKSIEQEEKLVDVDWAPW